MSRNKKVKENKRRRQRQRREQEKHGMKRRREKGDLKRKSAHYIKIKDACKKPETQAERNGGQTSAAKIKEITKETERKQRSSFNK